MGVREGLGLDEARELAVRAELERLLESSAFRASKRCREFLEYVVKHTLTGQSGSLKERSLGVELFRLPADFDPGQHTIVRVTANELRKKFAQYLSVRERLVPSGENRSAARVLQGGFPMGAGGCDAARRHGRGIGT